MPDAARRTTKTPGLPDSEDCPGDLLAVTIKYVAEIDSVREVSLVGTADLAFWEKRLATERLQPFPRNGAAQVWLNATHAKFRGVSFRELSFSVIVQLPRTSGNTNAVFLAHAFNSSRLFAFVERTFFSTPYYPGDLKADVGPPAMVRLTLKNSEVLHAAMAAEQESPKRAPLRSGEECWLGHVFLPSQSANANQRRMFIARLEGQMEVYAFSAADTLRIKPAPGVPILQWLLDSDFRATEWQLRKYARHAKSKTYWEESAPEL